MNNIIYIIFVIMLFSCKSKSVAQKKMENNIDKIKIEKPKFGDPNDNEMTKLSLTAQDQIPPNTVYLTGVISTIFENTSICETSYKYTAKVKVRNIIGTGSGIVNMISSNQEINFPLRQGVIRDITSFKTKFDKDLSLIIVEKPCSSFSQTVFEIVSIR